MAARADGTEVGVNTEVLVSMGEMETINPLNYGKLGNVHELLLRMVVLKLIKHGWSR
jgi:hypothetical protein